MWVTFAVVEYVMTGNVMYVGLIPEQQNGYNNIAYALFLVNCVFQLIKKMQSLIDIFLLNILRI